MTYRILHGDCIEKLRELIAQGIQVDSIVTDPPYELGFMQAKWDSTGISYSTELWNLALQVLKPGGHLLAFGGSRTYHRMACAIEDAGFEIRDSIRYLKESHYPAYVYGQGFPKSLNIKKAAIKQGLCCICEENTLQYSHEKISLHKELSGLPSGVSVLEQVPSYTQQELQPGVREQVNRHGKFCKDPDRVAFGDGASDLRPMCKDYIEAESVGKKSDTANLLSRMQRKGKIETSDKVLQQHEGTPEKRQENGGVESGLERRGNVLQEAWELQGSQIFEMPGRISAHGKEGWLHNGAQVDNGNEGGEAAHANGSSQPYRSQSSEQQNRELGTIPDECGSQKRGSWEVCGRCSKPILPEGLGTALKPAWEPIVLARKPISEKTVADNVIRHGTGAINIDACRVRVNREVERKWDLEPCANTVWDTKSEHGLAFGKKCTKNLGFLDHGRFPANLIHDGSDEVEDEFAKYGDRPSGAIEKYPQTTSVFLSKTKDMNLHVHSSNGSASRFFYCAKASKKDRQGSKHPTVKPIALMRYLCRLITPPGGTVLDMFAGTGTTGQAALEEGFSVILIEKESEYVADINRRMNKVALPLCAFDEVANG